MHINQLLEILEKETTSEDCIEVVFSPDYPPVVAAGNIPAKLVDFLELHECVSHIEYEEDEDGEFALDVYIYLDSDVDYRIIWSV